jgi:hypothetical protein
MGTRSSLAAVVTRALALALLGAACGEAPESCPPSPVTPGLYRSAGVALVASTPSFGTSGRLLLEVGPDEVRTTQMTPTATIVESWRVTARTPVPDRSPLPQSAAALSCIDPRERLELELVSVAQNGANVEPPSSADRKAWLQEGDGGSVLFGTRERSTRLEWNRCPLTPPTADAACEPTTRACWYPRNRCLYRCNERWVAEGCE